MDERSRWICHIKELRARHDVGILDAQRLALAEPAWRRWVDRQIKTHEPCRRMALRHLRDHGAASLIARDGDRLMVW